jgi:hypothetical protein
VASSGDQHADTFAAAYAQAEREAAQQFTACVADALAPVFAHRTVRSRTV